MSSSPTEPDGPTEPGGGPAPGSCRTRRRARPLTPGGQRPADLLAAFFVSGIAFLLAGGAVAALTAAGALEWWGRWLALHFLLLGGVSQLVLGAAQFFSTAYLATDPPARPMVRAQLAVWAAGTLLVAVSVPAGAPLAADLGVALIVVGLTLFWVSLRRLERRSLQTARWAIRWYYACAAFLVVGALIGMLLARHTAWSHGSLLGAHLALNLAGWLGTAIVGTLHTFYPSLTHSRLAYERLQGPAFVAWCAGVTVLAAGSAFDVAALVAAGWMALTAGALLLAVNIEASARAADGPLGLPARLVGAAQLFLVAGLALALTMLVAEGATATPAGDWRAALATLLIGGWIGMTVAGSLLHLLTVLYRVRNLGARMPRPRPRLDIALAAALSFSIAALALSYAPGFDELRDLARAAALICAAPVVWRILALAAAAASGFAPARKGVASKLPVGTP
ncbi:MAG: hypothetical protein HZB14_06140 [Actinobacteria bacterium]|nr:hypothetical protein [Actinomycetota bacterium]